MADIATRARVMEMTGFYKKIFSIIFVLAALFVSHPVAAQAPYNILNWYWIVGDSSPTSRVFSSASGTSVVNSDATYLTWLTATVGANPNGGPITGATNNGSGAIRITIGGTANFQTNQEWNISGVIGTTEANGNWPITVVDGTHIDLQGSTFSNAYASGGIVSGPSIIDTQVHLYAQFDLYAQSIIRPGYKSYSTTGPVTITNPVAWFTSMEASTTPIMIMPQANLPSSPPLGYPLVIYNADETTPLTINLSDTSTTIAGIGPALTAILIPVANTSTNGTWEVYYGNAVTGYTGTKTIRNSAGTGTCTMTFTGGQLTSSTC